MVAVREEPVQRFGVRNVEQLLVDVGRGDQAAFTAFYTLFSSRVFGLVAKVLLDRELAQEVTQEVFFQLWQQASRFDPERGSAVSWVPRIAHARAVDRVRMIRSRSRLDTGYAATSHVAETDTVVEDVLLHAEQRAIRAALLRLSPIQRESIQLAYYSGMTAQEISVHLGVGRSTVKTRIRDGLLKLGIDLSTRAPTISATV